MTIEQYDLAKDMFKAGKSLREISKELNINRKKLSIRLQQDGFYTSKHYNENIINGAIKLYKEGMNITNICKKLKIDRHILSNIFAQKGIRQPRQVRKKYTQFENEIINLYNTNLSIEKISKNMKVSTNVVWKCLLNNNIDTNKTYRKNNLNEDIFDEIDCEEKAYWLGFLYADGNVSKPPKNSVELSLKFDDKYHLEKFKNFMGSNANIQSREVSMKGKIYKSCRLSLHSKKLTTDLIKQGCIPNKSLVLTFPTTISKNLIHHFMRGYFDGDGYITISKPSNGKFQGSFGVIGTKKFLDKYDEFLLEQGINKTKYGRCGKAFNLRHGGNIQCKKIFNFLYKEATVYLERKYNIFNLKK